MKSPNPNAPKGGIGLQDILFVLFKHKWMILILSCLGLAASAAMYVTRKPIFQSEAKLLVRYVIDRRSVDTDDIVQATGNSRSSDSVLNSELEILRSGDLALQVAGKIGPERLLPGSPAATVSDAAGTIASGLEAKTTPNTKVIQITYRNADPALTSEVLRGVVDGYLEKHFEIHRSVGAFDAVAQQTEEVRKRLKATEDELNRIKTSHGIISLNDATTSFGSQRAKAQEDLNAAEAQFAEQKVLTEALGKIVMTESMPRTANPEPGDPRNPEPADQAMLGEYRALLENLSLLRRRDLELKIKYPPGSRLVVLNQQEINRTEARRQEMVSTNPALEAVATSTEIAPVDTHKAYEEAKAKLASIGARMEVFKNQLKDLQIQFTQLSDIGVSIQNLERRKEMEEGEYRLLESNLKRARVDQSLDPSKMPNISIVQQPSAPFKTYSDMANKLMLGLAGAGIAAGLGLAFLIELVFNRRINRPAEIESKLQLPLMLTIPFIRPRDRKELLLTNGPKLKLLENSEGKSYAVGKANKMDARLPEGSAHFMLPYTQAIRDRIVFNFGINNIHHKPKLIGLTGLTASAGTSTIAAGLAKAFSEANGVKVLLVDLNSNHDVANPAFERAEPLSLADALGKARDTGFKNDDQNLYLASTAAESGVSIFAPIHLQQLMPYLQSSDFDYILFDLPPMDHTSPTIAMAGLLDKILLVLDGDDTSSEGLKWGYSALVKGRADVSCIFNKARSHAPGWIAG